MNKIVIKLAKLYVIAKQNMHFEQFAMSITLKPITFKRGK